MDAFDFEGLAILFAGISIALIGLVMAGGAFWPEFLNATSASLPV